MGFDWGGLIQGVIGLAGAGGAVSSEASAANAASTSAAQNSAQALAMSKSQQDQMMSLYSNILGMQLKQQGPWQASGQRALMDYEYLATGRRPDTSQYNSPEFQSEQNSAKSIQQQIDDLMSNPVKPATTYTATQQARKAGGWLNPRIEYDTVQTPTTQTMDEATSSRDGQVARLRMQLAGLTGGSNTDAQMADYAKNWQAPDVKASPLYQFQQQQGETAINRQLRVKGLSASTFGGKALGDFYQNLGAQETSRVEDRYLNLMKGGQGAIAATGNSATNMFGTAGGSASAFANNSAGILGDFGNVQQDILGSGVKTTVAANNTIQSALSSLLSSFGGSGVSRNSMIKPTQNAGYNLLGIGV